jgi:hypothetical protein
MIDILELAKKLSLVQGASFGYAPSIEKDKEHMFWMELEAAYDKADEQEEENEFYWEGENE